MEALEIGESYFSDIKAHCIFCSNVNG